MYHSALKENPPRYIHTEDVHNTRAAEVIVPIVLQCVETKSVLDVGCGTGTWLKVFNQVGIDDFFGVDGEDLASDTLQIPRENFSFRDLTQPLNLNRTYGLAVSLEVAEHLPETSASTLVRTLVSHSKVILFSAAIPGQHGQNHINEQWPNYWQEKFAKHGYQYYDIVRPQIWNNKSVDVWYRQNIFLLYHESVKLKDKVFEGDNLIHPEFWNINSSYRKQLRNWETGQIGIRNALRTLRLSVKRKFLNR